MDVVVHKTFQTSRAIRVHTIVGELSCHFGALLSLRILVRQRFDSAALAVTKAQLLGNVYSDVWSKI